MRLKKLRMNERYMVVKNVKKVTKNPLTKVSVMKQQVNISPGKIIQWKGKNSCRIMVNANGNWFDP